MWTTILQTTAAPWSAGQDASGGVDTTVVLIRIAAVLLGFIPAARRDGGTIMAVRGQRCVKSSPP
ncbi:hypothetical protein JL100_001640 [Skermanella mucosa]|uniref:hypothetical protein n=1 Tax=Skermanella mucosa TaxID=1789672 RepID=UPI00192C9491|nr:hypothetical protein [Skermanella mucosa]UEM21500.1 hypothetical protein JL100_001640 [Skermanella mucosa]